MSFPGNLGLQCLTGLQFYLGTFLRKWVIQRIAFLKALVNLMFDKNTIFVHNLRNANLREEKKVYFGTLLKYCNNVLSLPFQYQVIIILLKLVSS